MCYFQTLNYYLPSIPCSSSPNLHHMWIICPKLSYVNNELNNSVYNIISIRMALEPAWEVPHIQFHLGQGIRQVYAFSLLLFLGSFSEYKLSITIQEVQLYRCNISQYSLSPQNQPIWRVFSGPTWCKCRLSHSIFYCQVWVCKATVSSLIYVARYHLIFYFIDHYFIESPN